MLQRKRSEQHPHSPPLKGSCRNHALPHGVPTEMGEGDSRHRGTKDAAGWAWGVGAATMGSGGVAGQRHRVGDRNNNGTLSGLTVGGPQQDVWHAPLQDRKQ